MIRKQSRLIADVEKILRVETGDYTGHNIPLSQNLIGMGNGNPMLIHG